MDLNFSKKTRKIVASLLAVAILLGVLPVSGLTGNSSGAESSSSENSTKTIYVNSTKQPILFDSAGNFKEIIPKVKKNIYSTEAENGDKIALFTDIGNGNSVVFYKTTEWTPSAYMWKEDSSENPDKNAAWPGEAMKKYGDSNSSLYYYVYGSAKGFDKVIFNDGNDQKNGDQTDNKDLKAWNVYTKTSAGRPICDSLTKCDVSDNFNVYEYADSKLSGKNISAPQGMGATIEIAGTKYTVCGDGAKSEITCYEDDKITSLTANTVDGYTAKVTNSVVGDNQITYSVTYTNKTYGMQFSVENTVTFIKKPRLVLEGKWTVTFNGKKYENGDTICNQKDSVKNLEAAFKIDSVTFNGKEISGYDAKTTLNGNSFDSSCGSNELEKENKLVATVYYEADNGKKYSTKSEFSFNYAEGDVTLSENEDGDTVYFDGNNIYTNSDSVTLTLNDESKIEDLTLKLYKGDSTPDSKNKIENAIEFDNEKGTITIGNKDVKLSEIKRATLTITSSKYNLSKTYTISYDTISKDNLKYSNTNENNERYYVNAEKGVTVTFNLVGIDKKLFNDENAKVTCNKENVEISFDKDVKEWKATIKKSDDYIFTFSHKGFVQTVKIIKQDLYLDDKAPEITGFSFQKAQSDTDKLLSFLTFGIYSNDKIIVTVNAKDEDILSTSSGIKNITLYDDGKILGTQTFNDYSTENTATFTLDESDKAYKLYAVVEDAVGYKSQKTTFDLGKKKDKDSYDVIEYNSEDSNGCLPELVSYSGNDKFSDLAVTPNEALKTYEKGNLFGYNAKDEAFKLELSESLSALSEATVTVSKEGSAKSFSTNPPITFNTTSKDTKKENCKFDYDLKLSEVFKAIGVSGSDISGNYTITVVAINNAGVSSKAYTYDFSIDNTAPKPDTFTISGESSTDKILKFLTFGIYSKKEIKVNVTANDKNPSSGIKTYTLYELKNDEYRQISDPTTDGNFTLVNRDEAYNLFVRVTDKFDNESDYYTFDYTGNKQDSYTATYDEAERPKKAPELVSYNGTDKFSDLTVTPENFKHQDNKGLFSYKKNGELFNIKLSESLSALSEATVTVNKDGSAKSFSETITFDTTSEDAKKKDCKLDYDLKLAKVFNDIGVSGSDISGKYTIKVKATNNASVTRDDYTYEFSIDNTAPVITLFAIENGSQNPIVDETSSQEYRYYFQHNTNVTVTAKDSASGVKEIHFRAYDVVKKDNAVDETKTVSSNNNAVFEVPANFKGEIYAYAVDKFDNSSIDKNIQGEGEKKPDDLIVETQQHHNGNASVTMSRAKASYKDNSGLDLYSGNVNARVVFEDTYAGIKDATITVYDYTNAVTGTIYAEIGNDGSIEKTEVTGSVNNIIFNDDYTTSKDNLLPKLVIDYVVTNNSNNIKITTSMTDRAGNKTDNVKDSLSIDKTKPVIDVKYDNNEHTTYGGNDYYKADRTATVTVTERNFDESLVEAAIMRNGGRYTTIGGWTHNNNTADPDKSTHVAKIVYNTDGDFTFDIAVKDKAMNSADKFTQQKFTVDKTAPVIDVSFDNNSAKNGNYYKADRTATIKITEHNFNSGSQYVNIPVTAEGTTAPSVVGWSGSGDDHNATVSFNKDGKYSFTVDYTDLAGNKAVQKKVDSFYIDKTAPEVEITGVADHQAYNGTVAPVVTYRDDNFTDDHDFKFTRIDINSKSDDTSKFDYDTDGNGVTEFIYKYRDFAEVLENDGIYNFTVELSDKAGNSTSKSVTFSVNRFGSTFKASDESEKLIKNGYTNAEQDIVVEEINVSPLTKHSVTLAKSGGNSTELVENTDYTFTSSNNGNEWCKSVYTVNKKNFSDEAAYTVTIMSVDKAKNTNNNRMADSSLSTEQKNKRECAISFVVDKTSPLVSITGIKDNELYKEASKKVKIVCEDDNLDKSKLFVTLDNKKLAEGEDYTIVDDKDGSIAGMLTAEIVLKAETGGIKENLKVTIGDLAGNTGEKSVDNFILSANIFQRFFANPVLVICTFAGLALVIAAVIFFVAKKRKKAE
ncbi:MAG: starch-binding protein [Ruminococcus sp.]